MPDLVFSCDSFSVFGPLPSFRPQTGAAKRIPIGGLFRSKFFGLMVLATKHCIRKHALLNNEESVPCFSCRAVLRAQSLHLVRSLEGEMRGLLCAQVQRDGQLFEADGQDGGSGYAVQIG